LIHCEIFRILRWVFVGIEIIGFPGSWITSIRRTVFVIVDLATIEPLVRIPLVVFLARCIVLGFLRRMEGIGGAGIVGVLITR
jgi:hypothetical protein